MHILIISGKAWVKDIARGTEKSLYLWEPARPGVYCALWCYEQVAICCWLLIIFNNNNNLYICWAKAIIYCVNIYNRSEMYKYLKPQLIKRSVERNSLKAITNLQRVQNYLSLVVIRSPPIQLRPSSSDLFVVPKVNNNVGIGFFYSL